MSNLIPDDSSNGPVALYGAALRLLLVLAPDVPTPAVRDYRELAAALDSLRTRPPLPADLSSFYGAIAGGEIGDPIGLGIAALLEFARKALVLMDVNGEVEIGPRERALLAYVDMTEETHDEAPPRG